MSHSSLHVLGQRINAKNAFKGVHKHRRDDDYHYGQSQPRYRREVDTDVVFSKPIQVNRREPDTRRGKFSIGDTASVMIANCIVEMTIHSFDPGSRAVMVDKQGFFHFVEPSMGIALAHGADFVNTMGLTSKFDAGFDPKKNVVLKSNLSEINMKLVNRKHHRRIKH